MANISFADPLVKQICAENWGSGGELTTAQAARVRDLGKVFQGKDITSFNELQYFTGLKRLTLGGWTFYNCSMLAEITIPDNIETIDAYAFYKCSNLQTVNIGIDSSKLSLIDNGAFSGCSSIDGFRIPKRVVRVGGNAFENCSALTYVDFGSSLRTIGNEAFKNCTSLVNIDTEDVTELGHGAFSGCVNLETVLLTEGILNIPAKCFMGCVRLGSISLPQSVKNIGWQAFKDCSNIVSIEMHEHIMLIADEAFSGCAYLSSVELPSDLQKLGYSAFEGCLSIRNITIPNGITQILMNTFKGCTNLQGVYFSGNALSTIWAGAFENCTMLTDITVPDNVNGIGYNAFAGTAWLSSQPEGVVYAGNVAYGYKGNVPSSVSLRSETKGIADSAFINCSSLKSITIPQTVTYIGYWAFVGSGLTSVTIPSSVNYIHDGCFNDCSSLKTITCNGDIERIGLYAISGCTSLTDINLYGYVRDIKTSFSDEPGSEHTVPTQNVNIWCHTKTAPENVESEWLKRGNVYLCSSSCLDAFRSAFSTNPGLNVEVHTNVCYMLDESTIYKVQWYNINDQIVYPENPTKPGYTFSHWEPELTVVHKTEEVTTAVFVVNQSQDEENSLEPDNENESEQQS